MDGDKAARLAEALAEAAQLRDENARLRQLLGLDNRRDDGHRTGWTPTLFTRPTESTTIGEAASIDEKVALLRTLFGARSDVFAIRGERVHGEVGLVPGDQGRLGQQAREEGVRPAH